MVFFNAIPRRCVNLPPGSLKALLGCLIGRQIIQGDDINAFYHEFGQWLGIKYVFGTATGRAACKMALEALALPAGKEIIFPAFTFPVIPMLAKSLGYAPVFCPVNPRTFNADASHIEPLITNKTGAVFATHLFGRPCAIEEITALCHSQNIRVIEDCAHACGVRVGKKQAGTFGDIGIFSFAQGKNMPCFGGGAVVTEDEELALRLQKIEARATPPKSGIIIRKALSIWVKWFITRPLIFSMTAYQVLRMKQGLGKSLMDNAVGNDLLDPFEKSNSENLRFANLQAAMGRLHLAHIDAFNLGSHKNGEILNTELANVNGLEVTAPHPNHIYVYYPLKLAPAKRDDLRNYLLRHGIDTKTTDMADCPRLNAFQNISRSEPKQSVSEAEVIEICIFPTIAGFRFRRIATAIRQWASLRST